MDNIFDLEVREKKNQAYLNKARTGSKGGSKSRKGMNTPFDYMNKKERNKLNGEVQTIMYETIIPKNEFFLKDEDMQKLMLSRWCEIYPVRKIQTDMKINNKAYYELIESLGIPKKTRGGSRVRKAKNIAIVEEEVKPQIIDTKEEEKEKVKPLLISRGLHLEYNGDYNSEELSKIFTKLQLLTDGEENKFTLAISLSERA